jgi:zinc protease
MKFLKQSISILMSAFLAASPSLVLAASNAESPKEPGAGVSSAESAAVANGASATAHGGAETFAKGKTEGVVREFKLANGLKVLFLEEHSFPVATCMMLYRVGSRNENLGETGLSHMVEHLLFQRVGKMRKGELEATIARNGGMFNGFTSDDFTVFFETFSPAKLPLALKVEAERMRSAVFSTEDFQNELKRIEHELEQEALEPINLLSKEVKSAAFQLHPYKNPTIGWRNDVSKLTIDDVKRHYREYYQPNNATLILVGDFNSTAVMEQVKQHFAALPAGEKPRPVRVVEPAQKAERRVYLKYGGNADSLSVAYHACAFSDSDAPALAVLEKILLSGNAGRLKQKLQDSKLCSSAKCTFEVKHDPGLFTFSLTGAPGAQAGKLQEALEGTLEALKSSLVSESELRRAKNHAEFQLLAQRDGPYRSALHLALFESLDNWPQAYSWFGKLNTVGAQDIQRVARRYFVTENRVLGILSGTNKSKVAPKPAAGHKDDSKDQSKPKAGDGKDKSKEASKGTSGKGEDSSSKGKNLKSSSAAAKSGKSKTDSDKGKDKKEGQTKDKAQDKKSEKSKNKAQDKGKDKTGKAKKSDKKIDKRKKAEQGEDVEKESAPHKPRAGKQHHPATAGLPWGSACAYKPSHVLTVSSALAAGAGGATGAEENYSAQGGRLKQAVLSNGLTIAVLETRLSPAVQLYGAIRAGEVYEPVGKRGVASLLAQVMNEGSVRYSKQLAFSLQDELGIPSSAMTKFAAGHQLITFQARCLPRDAELVTGMLASQLKEPAIAEASLETAKHVVNERIKHTDDSVKNRVQRALLRGLIAPNTSFYPLEPADKMRFVTNLKVSDVREFHGQAVRPDACALVFIGDISLEQAKDITQRAFDGFTGKSTAKRVSVQPNPRRLLKTAMTVERKQDTVVTIGKMVDTGLGRSDYPLMLIADCALTNHPFVSRFADKIVGETGMASSVSLEDLASDTQAYPDTTIWSVDIPLIPNAMPQAVKAIQSELKRFGKQGITPSEFSEVRLYLSGALPVRFMANAELASRFVLESLLLGGKVNVLPELQEAVRHASTDSVNQFIKTSFRPDRASVVMAGTAQSIGQVHGLKSDEAGDEAQAK